MADKSKIEWTDATWNPVTGCTKVSDGCRNCYAERMVKRIGERVHGIGQYGSYDEPEYDKHPFSRVVIHMDRMEQPLHWRKPRTVFVCSMGDLFHKDVPTGYINDVFAVMEKASQHTFIVLTKRADRMMQYSQERGPHLPNVIGMVSVENEETAKDRIPKLLASNFAVRGLSVEPMLGWVTLPEECRDGLHWVICGGESGPKARPMIHAHAHNLKEQCREYGIPFFFKQWGEYDEDGFRVGRAKAGSLLNGQVYKELPKGMVLR